MPCCFACLARVLARNKALVLANLDHLRAFMARHADIFSWREPKAGTLAFPRLLKRLDGNVRRAPRSEPLCGADAEAYAHKLVAEHGILLAPAPLFGSDAPCLRLGFGRANFPEVLLRWDNVLSGTGAPLAAPASAPGPAGAAAASSAEASSAEASGGGASGGGASGGGARGRGSNGGGGKRRSGANQGGK